MSNEAVKRYACTSYECHGEADKPGVCPECKVQQLAERVHEVWLPKTFWLDHAERALPAGDVVKWAGNRGLIKCSESELAEIASDADHYAHEFGPDADGLEGIKRSAKATQRAIKRYLERRAELQAIKARAAQWPA